MQRHLTFTLMFISCIAWCGYSALPAEARDIRIEKGSQLTDCRRVTAIAGEDDTELLGAEDITVHPQTGIAFISAQDRRNPDARGGIFTFDLRARPLPDAVKPVTRQQPEIFHPHGISLYLGNDTERLFVVNHLATDSHRIERFEVRGAALAYLGDPIEDADMLTSPNDVFAIGPERLYVTNDHGVSGHFAQLVEDLLRRNRANVVYYDGTRFRRVQDGFSYANGINGPPDSDLLYLATSRLQTLLVYRRGAGGDLTLLDQWHLGTAIDNIELDAEGNLWIGSHPKPYTFFVHAFGFLEHAPSQVIRLTGVDTDVRAEELYRNAGDQLSASSVAARYGDTVIIGPVFDRGILVCRTR